jgi:hypothetical protein
MQQAVDDVLGTIGVLFEPGDVIEIRALAIGRSPSHPGSTSSGYFNFENRDAIAVAVKQLDGRAEGVYAVLNRVNRKLLARANNRLQAKPKHTTSDADITEWRWLFIDADAIRPAGISATDIEHEAALQRAQRIREFLDERGWPAPIHGDSGNGGHLLYRMPPLDLAGCGKSLSASQMAPIDPRKSLILGSAKRDLCCFLHRSGLFPQPARARSRSRETLPAGSVEALFRRGR